MRQGKTRVPRYCGKCGAKHQEIMVVCEQCGSDRLMTKHEAIQNAIIRGLEHAEKYMRTPYDSSLSIRTALEEAGFEIVSKKGVGFKKV